MHHLVDKDTKRPPICSFIVSFSFENFRGKVLRSSTECFSDLAISNNLSHSKISEANVTMIIHKHVFEFKITIDEVF